MPDAMQPVAVIPDYDRDSIHTLPLSILPIANSGLGRARLIKNHRLETRVELFRGSAGGSGQIAIDEVPDFFPGSTDALQHDMALLQRIGDLPAFDPYTLRIGLRRAGVDVLDLDVLQLSAAKRAELRPLMRGITRPLAVYLFDAGPHIGSDLDALMAAIAVPNTPVVRSRLLSMALALRVGVDALPDMLDDYGDTYLAISYYRSYLMHVLPAVDRIIDWMRDVGDNSFLRDDANVQQSIQRVEAMLSQLTTALTSRFNGFERQKVMNWNAVTVESFRSVHRLVSEHQQSLAAVLCGLTVKISEWEQRFPNGGGSPEKRVDFVTADLKPGLDMLWQIERSAPRFADSRPRTRSAVAA